MYVVLVVVVGCWLCCSVVGGVLLLCCMCVWLVGLMLVAGYIVMFDDICWYDFLEGFVVGLLLCVVVLVVVVGCWCCVVL